MTRKRFWSVLPLLSLCGLLFACGQVRHYTAANAHSHNDYEQRQPLAQAIRAGFGSVEADIFLRNDTLFVAHDVQDIAAGRTLEALYLEPLSRMPARSGIQLLIDLKTGADSTLPVLVARLRKYPALTGETESGGTENGGRLKVVISGNRPALKKWTEIPGFIYFDGRPGESYPAAVLGKVGLISDNFANYSQWDGAGAIAESETQELRRIVQSAHKLGKPFRFWGVPDTRAAWQLMTQLEVDYINTDSIEALATWLKSNNDKK